MPSGPSREVLKRQIANDPRVIALLQQRGGAWAMVDSNDLRQLGYDVPGDWKVAGNPVKRAGRNAPLQPYVFEETDWGDAVAWTGAAAVGGYAGGAAAAGAGAGGGGGVLPSSTIPGLHEAVPGAIASQGASAGITTAPLASRSIPGLHEAVPGHLPPSQNVSRTVPPLQTGGGSRWRNALDELLSPEGALRLASLVPALAGGPQNIADDPNVQRQMDIANQSQQMQLDRYKRTDPLHESTVRAAMARLPIAARNK